MVIVMSFVRRKKKKKKIDNQDDIGEKQVKGACESWLA